MDSVKVAVGTACSILVVLVLLLVFLKNPERALYDRTMETLMIQEGFSSQEELQKRFPKLRDIDLKMKRIASLNANIRCLTGGPAPNISEKERQQLSQFREEIKLLERSIKEELTLMAEPYNEDQSEFAAYQEIK